MSGDIDRVKLAKTLGMLGSAHDGEALAAARQVERMRQEADLTWDEISDVAGGTTLPSPPEGSIVTVKAAIEFLLARVEHLTAREHDFVVDLRYRPFAPSPKQLAWLNRILSRVCHGAEARAA